MSDHGVYGSMRAGTRRRIWFFLLAAAVVVGAAVHARGERFVLVRWVDDGDTIVLADGRRVRYIGVNAPEVARDGAPGQRFGDEATTFNKDLVFKKKVRLEFDRERFDQYRRVLAYVFLEDGTFVNGEMVRTGHAYFVFREPNRTHDSKLLALQRQAMAGKAGIWKDRTDREGPFLGNRRSRRFHSTACPFGRAMRADHRVIFKTSHDAFWEGYSPCKKCLGGGDLSVK